MMPQAASQGSHPGADDRPDWARRIRAERLARGWSQAVAVEALRAHAPSKGLPSNASLLRNWKRWEAGEVEPDDFCKPLIAVTFGTVTAVFFPPQAKRADADAVLLAESPGCAGRCRRSRCTPGSWPTSYRSGFLTLLRWRATLMSFGR
jgi:hypothetical protein